jgi:hypothetical protein
MTSGALSRSIRLGTVSACLALASIDAAAAQGATSKPMSLTEAKPIGAVKAWAETLRALTVVSESVRARWTPNCAPGVEQLSVRVRVRLEPAGGLRAPPELVEPQLRSSGYAPLEGAISAALSAVEQAAPFEGLPVSDYESWKQFIIRFDGKEACTDVRHEG